MDKRQEISISLKEINSDLESFVFRNKNFILYTSPSENDDYIIKFCKLKNEQYEGVARISMKEPKYIDCEVDNYILSKEDIKEFIEALKSDRMSLPYRYDDEEYPYTTWQLIIEELNFIYKMIELNKLIPRDLPMPDYTLLPTRN